MFKKLFLLTLILFGIMLAGSTAEAAKYGAFYYTTSGTNATITWYDGSATPSTGVITIPSYINGYTVTEIGDSSFDYSSDEYYPITAVNFPSELKTIGENAFYGCDSLKKVSFPRTLKTIGKKAFYGCSALTSITIPNNVESIGIGAFMGCESATSLSIGTGITSIAAEAFRACISLTNITIPSNVTSIGDMAFYNCTGVTEIILPQKLTSIGNRAFVSCKLITSIQIPDSVTSIGEYAFYKCAVLTSVYMGDNVKTIGIGAFDDCDKIVELYIDDIKNWCQIEFGNSMSNPLHPGSVCLYVDDVRTRSLFIPNGTPYISSRAFYNCSDINSVTIPDSVQYIGASAFYNNVYLSLLTIGDGVTSIGDSAFYNSRLREIIIPDSVISIGSKACYDAGASKIVIPDSVETIGDYAFYGCGLNITIGKNVKTIGKNAFEWDLDSARNIYISDLSAWCEIEFANATANPMASGFAQHNLFLDDTLIEYDLLIPDNITKIGAYAFYGYDHLSHITLPYGVTSIGDYAFYGNYLETFSFEDSVTSIGKYAFQYNSTLTDVYFYGTQNTWNSLKIGSYNSHLTNATLHIVAPTVYLFYNPNGGKGLTWLSVASADSTAALTPVIPERLGHTFLGWSTDYDASVPEYDNSITVGRKDIYLFAVWQQTTYTDASVSGGSTHNAITVTPHNIPDGSSIILACYKNNALVYTEVQTKGIDNLIYTVPKTYDKFKILTFENLNSMLPLTEPTIK